MLAIGQDATALLDPLPIDVARDVILDPDQEHDHQTEHERKRQIIVRDLGIARHRRKRVRAEQRHDQHPPEADIEARQCQHDEATRRQPMREAFEARETQNFGAGETVIDTNPATHHQEYRQEQQHSEDRNTADDRQLAALKISPVAARRLDQAGSHIVRDRYPPGDLVALLQRVQEFVFLDGFSGRLERKLCGGGMRERQQQCDGSAQRPEV